MKKQKKNSQSLYLQKSNNNRWKWMAGATAATAAGVTASQGSAITINLVDNYISSPGGNHLNADLTGDGHPDLTITGAFIYVQVNPFTYNRYVVGVNLNGVQAYATFSGASAVGVAQLGSQRSSGYTVRAVMGSIPVFFKDLHINGGTPTRGSVEVTVSDEGTFGPEVRLDSLTYTSNTAVQGSTRAVPDQGPSLALLAMGAGGVLALRRWRAAQKPA